MSEFSKLPPNMMNSIYPWHYDSIGYEFLGYGGSANPSSRAWISGSNGVCVPFYLQDANTALNVFWDNGSQIANTGTVDVGVYTVDGTLLFSCGPQRQSGTSSLQVTNLANPYYLTPGLYYMAMSMSSTGAIIMGPSINTPGFMRVLGLASIQPAHPLPPTGAFIPFMDDQLPLFGIGFRTIV